MALIDNKEVSMSHSLCLSLESSWVVMWIPSQLESRGDS